MPRASRIYLPRNFAALLVLLGLIACTSAIPRRDSAAIAEAEAIRTAAISLMAAAGEPFAGHAAEAAALTARIGQARDAAKAMPGSGDIASAWADLIDPAGTLLGKYLAEWEARGTLAAALRQEFSAVITDALDDVVKLETQKPE